MGISIVLVFEFAYTKWHIISGKHAQELYEDFYMPPKASQSDTTSYAKRLLNIMLWLHVAQSCIRIPLLTDAMKKTGEKNDWIGPNCEWIGPDFQWIGPVY